MKVIYDPRHVFFQPKNIFENSKIKVNPDNPNKIESIVGLLKKDLRFDFIKPMDFPRSYLYLAHDQEYILWLKTLSKKLKTEEEYFPKVFGYDKIYDTQTPITNNTFEMAWISAKCALTGADYIIKTANDAYCLTRPSGIHAGLDNGGGKCYLNNGAIAAKYIQSKTNAYIAILNIGSFHANGTQEIFYEDNTTLTISIHSNPSDNFPYISGYEWELGCNEGRGYNINFPLSKNNEAKDYIRVLEKAILEIKNFDPDFFIITLSTDMNEKDENSCFKLNSNDFKNIGNLISKLEVPKLILQENGYNSTVNEISIKSFFDGLII
ncbi:hypothetical protein OF820_13180 [Oceanotoga sp. DSM 15011]|jgi:acetoin utilization deacetylase AcuC-like enzyme|uniref:hypothetical protein n=1 Tax=Oceanotoga sp. DSM 15011 TaxID=2984951 RepID=UPI0021F4C500|nr:hypothetical protein [Oceanotoga sp. DSM 15011]UYO99986.1 hypothetical protein OF820_13180 [Oceanotoga sp. DSM 15011]